MEKEKSFEKILQDIDVIVSKLESGEVGLEESIKLYEQGSKLIKESEGRLKESKMKLETIKSKNTEVPTE